MVMLPVGFVASILLAWNAWQQGIYWQAATGLIPAVVSVCLFVWMVRK